MRRGRERVVRCGTSARVSRASSGGCATGRNGEVCPNGSARGGAQRSCTSGGLGWGFGNGPSSICVMPANPIWARYFGTARRSARTRRRRGQRGAQSAPPGPVARRLWHEGHPRLRCSGPRACLHAPVRSGPRAARRTDAPGRRDRNRSDRAGRLRSSLLLAPLATHDRASRGRALRARQPHAPPCPLRSKRLPSPSSRRERPGPDQGKPRHRNAIRQDR